MTKYTIIVTDETIFRKLIDVPDDQDPQDYADEDFMNDPDSYDIQDATYSIQLIQQESTNA